MAAFSHHLDEEARALLGEGTQDTIIMAAEFVAVSCAVDSWRHMIQGVPLIIFIVNNFYRDIMMSCRGRSPLMHKLLKHYLRLEYQAGFMPWAARVPSPNNYADKPSRNKFDQFCWANRSVTGTDISASLKTILSCL